MGNYASQADLKDRFDGDAEVAFLTDTEETGTPDTDVLDDCLESAEAAIDFRIAVRYRAPIHVGGVALASSGNTQLIAAMKRLTVDLAEVYLLRRGPQVSDEKEKQLADAIATADRLADGSLRLPGADMVDAPTTRDPLASWTGSNRSLENVETRKFSRETMSSL